MKNRILKLSSLCLGLLILVSSFSVLTSINAFADADSLPNSVDNSQSKYFPEIGHQGDQGACVCWAQVYYQFTYMMNRAMDVEATPENTFSPTWIYNFANGGRGEGTWEDDVYDLMKEIGNVPLKTVPHNTEDYNNWFPTEEIWQEAMQYRIKDYTIFKDIGKADSQITSPDDADLYNIKNLLAQGEVLAVTTYISSWDTERIKAHPDAPENDKYVDEYVVRLCDDTNVRHRLALVGYNDNIWTDVNDNGKIDSGEMGALKIANSWGTDRHNEGFMWIAYDALNKESCVSGCPTVDYRPEIFHDFTRIEVIPYDTDTDLYLRYTLNTADRSQGKIYATATKDGKEYTFEVGPKRDHGMKSSTYSYDGTTNANDGTMVCALSNFVPDITPETLHEYTWSIKFEDTTSDGKKFTVKNMEIVDDSTGRISKPGNAYPFTLDGSSKTVTFPSFEEYVPVITTAVSTTATQTVTSEPSEATTVTTVATKPVTTVTPTETTLATDPTETTVAPTTQTVSTTTEPVVTTTTTSSTEATTVTAEVATESTTVAPTYTSEYIIGDSNESGDISISDATLIQKFAALLVDTEKLNTTNSDCNKDGKISIKDVTCIQKYLAKLKGFEYVGEKYSENIFITDATEIPTAITTEPYTTVVTTPTETTASIITDPTEGTAIITTPLTAPTETVTEPIIITTTTAVSTTVTSITNTVIPTFTTALPTVATTVTSQVVPSPLNNVTFTNSFRWNGTIYCYYWSDDNQSMTAWPGVAMKSDGINGFGEALYTLEIPKGATYVIFTNGSVQTVDIPFSGGEQKFYPVSANGEGKYTVENW